MNWTHGFETVMELSKQIKDKFTVKKCWAGADGFKFDLISSTHPDEIFEIQLKPKLINKKVERMKMIDINIVCDNCKQALEYGALCYCDKCFEEQLLGRIKELELDVKRLEEEVSKKESE